MDLRIVFASSVILNYTWSPYSMISMKSIALSLVIFDFCNIWSFGKKKNKNEKIGFQRRIQSCYADFAANLARCFSSYTIRCSHLWFGNPKYAHACCGNLDPTWRFCPWKILRKLRVHYPVSPKGLCWLCELDGGPGPYRSVRCTVVPLQYFTRKFTDAFFNWRERHSLRIRRQANFIPGEDKNGCRLRKKRQQKRHILSSLWHLPGLATDGCDFCPPRSWRCHLSIRVRHEHPWLWKKRAPVR